MRKMGPALVCLLGCVIEVYTLGFHYTTHVEAKGEHQVLLREFGARVPITQTFTMLSDGLKGVRVRLAARERCDITFDWQLFDQRQPTGGAPLAGSRSQLRNVSGETWVDMLFPPITHSRGTSYRLDVRIVDVQVQGQRLSPVPASDAAALVASYDHAMPDGSLLVDGVERWGDLVLDTFAVGDTLLGRFMLTTASGTEGLLQRVLLPAAALGLYNVLFVTFVIYFWPRTRTVPPDAALRRSPEVAARAALPAIARRMAIAVCLVGATAVVTAGLKRYATVDLIDQLHRAELRTPMHIHVAFAVVPDLVVSNEPMRAIAAIPPSEIAWTVTVPPRARLRTAMATDPLAWNQPGDGVVFRIGVSENGTYSEMFAHHLDPARVPADRRWVPVDLDLSRFSGRRIRLIFKTDESLPGRPPNSAYDWARWGEPRLVTE